MKAKEKKQPEDPSFLEVTIRYRPDGGPMFDYLSSLNDRYARGERIRQLTYLGYLVENGLMGFIAPGGAPTQGRVVVSPTSNENRSRPKASSNPAPSSASATEEAPETAFAADDLMAVFGASAQGKIGA